MHSKTLVIANNLRTAELVVRYRGLERRCGLIAASAAHRLRGLDGAGLHLVLVDVQTLAWRDWATLYNVVNVLRSEGASVEYTSLDAEYGPGAA